MQPIKFFQRSLSHKSPLTVTVLWSNLWTPMNKLFVSVRRESRCSPTVHYEASMLFYRCTLSLSAAAQALKKQLKQDILLELHWAALLICCRR